MRERSNEKKARHGLVESFRPLGSLLLSLLVLTQAPNASSSNLASSGLEDDLHFVFKWHPADMLKLKDPLLQNLDMLQISTPNAEKYKCSIPISLPEDHDMIDYSQTASREAQVDPSMLIANIYNKKFCSYRIESYWIYELCHGQYIKQYHETKNAGKRVVTEEYFLGYYNADRQEPDYIEQGNKLVPNVQWRTLDGQKVATYAVKYTDGTMCEVLTSTPREITIFYACDENGNDNIATFEEISSCVYEMIVVTKWVCLHPAFKLPEKTQQTISCFAADENSPAQPIELSNMENERNMLKNDENKIKMTDRDGDTFIIHYRTIDDGDEPVDDTVLNGGRQEFSFNFEQQQQPDAPQPPQQPSQHDTYYSGNGPISTEAEKTMIAQFLSGAQCLQGGSGWWKYEVCLGRHVTQYHEDEASKHRTNVLLGTWSGEKHVEWVTKYPNKRPLADKNERMSLSLFYSNGDRCDNTNKNRFVEVKFRCIKSREKSHAVSLYLIEPKTCEYLLAVESPWLCNFIKNADGNGLPTSLSVDEQGVIVESPPPPADTATLAPSPAAEEDEEEDDEDEHKPDEPTPLN